MPVSTVEPTPPTRRDVSVTGLSLSGPLGPVFGPVGFSFDFGDLVVVSGSSGSGRTSLLLALAGRMRKLTGRGRFGDFDLVAQAEQVRRRVAIARVGGVVDLEPQLTVEESITERALADAVPLGAARRRLEQLQEALAIRATSRDLVGALPRFEQAKLALALACTRPADLIVIDDIDQGLSRDEQRGLIAAMVTVTHRGPAVAAAALDTDVLPAGTVVVHPHPPRPVRPAPTPALTRPSL